MRSARLISLIAVVWMAMPLQAAEWNLQLDPTATRVDFTLGATLHQVEGMLPLKEGALRFEPAGGAASGRLVFDAAAAGTGNAARDRKMHAKVLESARFGEIVFTVERAEIQADTAGSGTVGLIGRLAIHGREQPLTIQARVRREGDRAFAEGDLTIPYVAWGMADPSAFVLRVAKEVHVHFTASGKLTPPGEP